MRFDNRHLWFGAASLLVLACQGPKPAATADLEFRLGEGRCVEPGKCPALIQLQLGQQLRAQGLASARIGLELDFWPVADFELLKAVLPRACWVDASREVSTLKSFKSPAEIGRLSVAAALAEARPDAIRDEWRVAA